MKRKLLRAKDDKKIAGVCGGIAKYFDIDATIIRLIWVFFIFCAGGGLLAYVICAIVIPCEDEIMPKWEEDNIKEADVIKEKKKK